METKSEIDTFGAAGLVWQANPSQVAMSWADAKAYCAKLDLAGGGWRLPTKEELLALYATHNMPKEFRNYWSSTSAEVPGWVYCVSAAATFAPTHPVTSNQWVRCVR